MRRLMLSAVLVAVAMAMFAVSAASAAKPEEVTGIETFVLTPTCSSDILGPVPGAPDCKTANGNLFFSMLNPGSRTGTFTGTQVFEGDGVLFENFDFVYNGIITFEGTVEGCGEGTVVFFNEGSGNLLTGLTRNVQHTLPGKGTLNVQANLDLVAAGPSSNTISGTYHC